MFSWPSRVGRLYYPALRQAPGAERERLRIRVTRPPYPCAGMGGLRIVAERRTDSHLEWVLAYERYYRLGS